MRHIKVFEDFENFSLELIFHDPKDFKKAKNFFEYDSIYNPYRINDETQSFRFECSDGVDSSTLENLITAELEQNDFTDYIFKK